MGNFIRTPLVFQYPKVPMVNAHFAGLQVSECKGWAKRNLPSQSISPQRTVEGRARTHVHKVTELLPSQVEGFAFDRGVKTLRCNVIFADVQDLFVLFSDMSGNNQLVKRVRNISLFKKINFH